MRLSSLSITSPTLRLVLDSKWSHYVPTSRWLPRQQRPCHHSFPPWEDLEVARPTLLARCQQVLLPPPPTVQTTRKWMLVPASTPTVMVGRKMCSFVLSFILVSYWSISSLLCARSQMALSLGHSFPPEQRRRCGLSGKDSNIHRVMQSSILMLRATSKTCFLWVLLTFLNAVVLNYSESLNLNLSLVSDSGCVVYPGPAEQLQQWRLWDSHVPAI